MGLQPLGRLPVRRQQGCDDLCRHAHLVVPADLEVVCDRCTPDARHDDVTVEEVAEHQQSLEVRCDVNPRKAAVDLIEEPDPLEQRRLGDSIRRKAAVLCQLPEASVSGHSIRRCTRMLAGDPSPSSSTASP